MDLSETSQPVHAVRQASKAVIVVGPQAKPYCAIDATIQLADESQYATAVMPNAKVPHWRAFLLHTLP